MLQFCRCSSEAVHIWNTWTSCFFCRWEMRMLWMLFSCAVAVELLLPVGLVLYACCILIIRAFSPKKSLFDIMHCFLSVSSSFTCRLAMNCSLPPLLQHWNILIWNHWVDGLYITERHQTGVHFHICKTAECFKKSFCWFFSKLKICFKNY